MGKLYKPIQGDGAVQPGEKKLHDYLVAKLPADYYIIPNGEYAAKINGAVQFFEYDCIVIAPHGIYHIENKDWAGKLQGDDELWFVNGAERKNPHKSATYKSRILASKLQQKNPSWRFGIISTIVTLSHPQQSKFGLDPQSACFAATFQLDQPLLDFLTNPDAIRRSPNSISEYAKDIAEYLSGATSQRNHAQRTRICGRIIDEVLQRTEDFTEYLCHPQGFVDKYYRVREYPLVRDESPMQMETFRRKVENAQTAQEIIEASPYILKSEYRINDEETMFYEIAPYMAANTVKARSHFKTFTQIEKLKIISDVAQALKVAHSKGVFHRNVNPENIFILNDGTAQLGNFNFAWFAKHSDLHYSVGTGLSTDDNPYAAPELREDDVCEGTDIYSLGVIFYELMTGKVPFDSPLKFHILGGELTPDQLPTAIIPDLPKWVDEFVQNTIVEDLDKRWYDAQQVIDFINSHLYPQESKENNNQSSQTQPKTNVDLKDLKSGDQISNDLVLYEELGKGGFGRVFKAKHLVQDEFYAAKVFDKSVAANETINEFEALRGLNNPHIVRFIYNGKTDQGMFYTLMELLEGDNLSDYTKSKGDMKLPLEEIYKMATQTLDALVYMQSQEPPIYHRDIKPNNIVWDNRQRYVLIDFNISTSTDDKSFAGTLPYLAPDLVESSRRIAWDKSADTFSLGVTLYELLAHNYPWPGSNPCPNLRNAATDIRNYRSDLSEQFADFVMKSLVTDNKCRFTTAKDMLDALKAIGVDGLMKLKKGDVLAVSPYAVDQDIVDYINSLYSQSSHGNSGTRAGIKKSPFDSLTYTETKLDKKLIADIEALKYKLIIITGNAGDGKTAFIHQVENRGTDKESFETRNGSRFSIGGVRFESNYDGSQDEDAMSNTEVLSQFFKPFEGLTDYTSAPEGRIIAINEGRLVDFLSERPEFKNLKENIEEYFYQEGHTELIPGLMVINLNLRSVTAKSDNEPSLLRQQIKALTKPDLWGKCSGCPVADRCFIKYNVDTMQDTSAGDEVITRLEWLLRTIVYKRELHITMRDLRSFIAFMLTRDHSCAQVKTLIENITADKFAPEFYWQYYYFNITAQPFYNTKAGFETVGLDSNDRLVQMVRDTDIARVAIPALDRDLYYQKKDKKDYLVFNERERSLIDDFNRRYELLPYYELESDPNRKFLLKERHQTWIRHRFFEGADKDSKTGNSLFMRRLPYQSIESFYQHLHLTDADVEKLAETKENIATAISKSEGCANSEMSKKYLLLSCSHINDPLSKSYRVFDVDEFELFVNETPNLTEYLEYESDSFTFRHKADHRIQLTVSLDLYEMLDYIKKGFNPSVNDLQGRFIELQIFKNLLESKTYDKILVTKNNKKFYVIRLNADNTLSIEPLNGQTL